MRLVGKDLKQLVVGPKVLKHREVWWVSAAHSALYNWS